MPRKIGVCIPSSNKNRLMKPVSFFTILKSEHYKLRFNIAIWLFLLFPFFITLCIDVYILFKHADAVNNPAITFDYNPWVWLLGRYIFEFYALLYPILAAVLSYSLCDVEYKNYGFRLLFTRPMSKVTVYSSKIVFLLEIIFISSLIGYLTFLLSGFALDKLLPGYKFSSYNVNTLMASYFSYLFIALSAVSFIQYNLSLIFKSFVLPIGFASLMTIFGIIAQNKDYAYLIPYSTVWRLNHCVYSGIINFSKGEYASIAYVLFFIIISFFVFIRKK